VIQAVRRVYDSAVHSSSVHIGHAARREGTGVGTGKGVYFLRPTQPPQICKPGVPLTFRNVSVYKVPAGGHFDLSSWAGDGGAAYSL